MRRKKPEFRVKLRVIRHDDTEARLLLAKALTALQMAKPTNDRSRQQINAARSEITQALNRRAAA